MAEMDLATQYARALGAAEAALTTIKCLAHGRSDNTAAIVRVAERAEADIKRYLAAVAAIIERAEARHFGGPK